MLCNHFHYLFTNTPTHHQGFPIHSFITQFICFLTTANSLIHPSAYTFIDKFVIQLSHSFFIAPKSPTYLSIHFQSFPHPHLLIHLFTHSSTQILSITKNTQFLSEESNIFQLFFTHPSQTMIPYLQVTVQCPCIH